MPHDSDNGGAFVSSSSSIAPVAPEPSGGRAAVTPDVAQRRKDSTRQARSGRAGSSTFGEAPEPTLTMLRDVVDGGGSLLTLLVRSNDLMRYAREPESYEDFLVRHAACVRELERATRLEGSLKRPAEIVQKRPGWRNLALAARGPQEFQSLFVDGICKDFYNERRQLLLDEIEHCFEDHQVDRREQVLLEHQAADLGFTDAEMKEMLREVSARDERRTIVEPEPLEGRKISVTSLAGLRDEAEKDIAVTLEELATWIDRDNLRYWLGGQFVSDQPVAQAWERTRNRLKLAREPGEERDRVLSRSSWDVLWSVGLPWIDLRWGDARASGQPERKCRTTEDLRYAVEEEGLETLLPAVGTETLSVWMGNQSALADSFIEAARDAESAFRDFGADHDKTRVALARVAWRLGLSDLRVHEDIDASCVGGAEPTGAGFVLDDVDDFLVRNPRDEHLGRLALNGHLEAWIQETLEQSDFKGLRGVKLPSDPHGFLRVQLMQWRLGRRSLEFGAFKPREAVPAEIVKAAQRSWGGYLDFGESVRDGSLLVWLEAVAAPATKAFSAEVTELVLSPASTALIAQLGCEIFGATGLVVPPADGENSSRPRFIAGLRELSGSASDLWDDLSDDEYVPILAGWINQQVGRTIDMPSADSTTPVSELLLGAGDTTLRFSDGSVALDDKGAAVGGFGKSAEATRTSFLGWLQRQEALPLEVDALAEDGSLWDWSRRLFPDRFRRLEESWRGSESPRERMLALLWALGYGKLVVFSDTEVGRKVSGNPLAVFEDVAGLVEGAHKCWPTLALDAWYPIVHRWLSTKTDAPLPDRRDSATSPLAALLADLGDTTIRRLDGTPLQSATTKGSLGGLGVKAADVRRAFVGWLESLPAPPKDVALAFEEGMLQQWARSHDAEFADQMDKRVATQNDPQARFLACLWSFGYGRLALSDSVSVADTKELIAVARENMADIERLFDTKVLDAWVSEPTLRARLENAHEGVDKSIARLARLGAIPQGVAELQEQEAPGAPGPDEDMIVARRAAPSWLTRRFEEATSLVRAPRDSLLVMNRAAVAVAALGGRIDQWEPTSQRQTATNLPADEAVDVPVDVRIARQGDVPSYAVVAQSGHDEEVIDASDLKGILRHSFVADSKNGERSIRCHPVLLGDERPYVHFEADELARRRLGGPRSFDLVTLSIDKKSGVGSKALPFALDARTSFASARFREALLQGVKWIPAAVGIAATAAVVLAWMVPILAQYFVFLSPRQAFSYHWRSWLSAVVLTAFFGGFVWLWARVLKKRPEIDGEAPQSAWDKLKASSEHAALVVFMAVVFVATAGCPLVLGAAWSLWHLLAMGASVSEWFSPACYSWTPFVQAAVGVGLSALLLSLYALFAKALWRYRFRWISAGTLIAGAALWLGLAM